MAINLDHDANELSADDGLLRIAVTGGVKFAAGTSAQRPAGLGADDAGTGRFNTDSREFEIWSGSLWENAGQGVSDTDDVAEGSINLYYTDGRVQAAVAAYVTGGDRHIRRRGGDSRAEANSLKISATGGGVLRGRVRRPARGPVGDGDLWLKSDSLQLYARVSRTSIPRNGSAWSPPPSSAAKGSRKSPVFGIRAPESPIEGDLWVDTRNHGGVRLLQRTATACNGWGSRPRRGRSPAIERQVRRNPARESLRRGHVGGDGILPPLFVVPGRGFRAVGGDPPESRRSLAGGPGQRRSRGRGTIHLFHHRRARQGGPQRGQRGSIAGI